MSKRPRGRLDRPTHSRTTLPSQSRACYRRTSPAFRHCNAAPPQHSPSLKSRNSASAPRSHRRSLCPLWQRRCDLKAARAPCRRSDSRSRKTVQHGVWRSLDSVFDPIFREPPSTPHRSSPFLFGAWVRRVSAQLAGGKQVYEPSKPHSVKSPFLLGCLLLLLLGDHGK